MNSSKRNRFAGFVLMGSVATLGIAVPVYAQEAAPRMAPAAPAPNTLSVNDVLARINKITGVVALADSTVDGERVPQSRLPAGLEAPMPAAPGTLSRETEQQAEQQIKALVKLLPSGTIWGKLFLPEPKPARVWKGDEVAAFAFAAATLYGKIGVPTPSGYVEILGQKVPADKADAYIAELHLKPVYLVSNPSRQSALMGGNALEPWTGLTRNQWLQMSREEQKQYGQEQAAMIMNLPPEQRAQMLKQMKQMDHFFDSIKDPLEKLIGHDL